MILNGFQHLVGAGQLFTSGKVFYVNSSTGSNGAEGTSPDVPFRTIDYAIGRCQANHGDIIVVLPGHAETISAAGGITLDVAGISIFGLGSGDARPTLTMSATTSSVLVTGASCAMKGFIITNSIDGVTNPLHIQAAGFDGDIEFRDSSSTVEMVRGVLTTAAADRLKLNIKYLGQTGGDACVNAVRLVGCNGADIAIDFYGLASTGVVEFVTTACTDVDVRGTIHNSGNSVAKGVVDTQGSSTWTAEYFDSVAGTMVRGGSGKALRGVNTEAGTQFTIVKTFTSSSIPNNTQTGGALTTASSGTLILRNLILQTNSTGLAGPTNIEISTDNAKGLTGAAAPNILKAVSGLGANKTVVCGFDASGETLPLYLEDGKKLYIDGDDAAGTGAGTVDVIMTFERVSDGATIAAA